MVATKYLPLPFHLNARHSLVRHLKKSLERLGRDHVDLYQIHATSLSIRPVESLAAGLADAHDQGLAKAVGVSNFSESELRRAHKVLAERGIQLASNQIEFSLLRMYPQASGLLQAAKELGVTTIAFSPFAQGWLTGKYSAKSPPPRDNVFQRRFGRVPMQTVDRLLEKMREIGESHGGKTTAQVALNWCMCKGVVSIPGAKYSKQVEDNTGALGWKLTDEEVKNLETLGNDGTSNYIFQHG